MESQTQTLSRRCSGKTTVQENTGITRPTFGLRLNKLVSCWRLTFEWRSRNSEVTSSATTVVGMSLSTEGMSTEETGSFPLFLLSDPLLGSYLSLQLRGTTSFQQRHYSPS